jgi:hypothetical protein
VVQESCGLLTSQAVGAETLLDVIGCSCHGSEPLVLCREAVVEHDMKKFAAVAAIGVLGLGAFASTDAEAQYRRYGGYHSGYGGYQGGYYGGGYRRSSGGAVAAGAIFGLAAGALLAGAATAPAYGYYNQPVYYAPPRRRVVTRVVTYPAYPPYYGGYYGGGYPGRGYYGW